ncbi:MAG TPA: DUF5666 domain-containing protein [Armatimonadota bacterium]|nr:DUF5666 domain-containing protein [Armatimonadota bacterium]
MKKITNLVALGATLAAMTVVSGAQAKQGQAKPEKPKPGQGQPKPENPGQGQSRRQYVVSGVVAGVGDGGFSVQRRGGRGAGGAGQDVAVTVDDKTQYLKSDGSAGSLADVVAEARVQAKGTRNEDGSILARRVLIVRAPGAAPAE